MSEKQERPLSGGRALANAAIFYHPDAHVSDRPQVKGRHMAGAGFLHGFVAHAQVERLQFYVESQSVLGNLKTHLARLGTHGRPVEAMLPHELKRLQAVGCVQCPDPHLAKAAWARRHLADRAYSLVGLTHTISSEGAMEAFSQYLVAPVQPWDALICTSACVKAEVEAMIGSYADYLAQRFGARPGIPLQLPVIPLGVDAGAYAPVPSMRAGLRNKLGIADGDVAILFLGRLSFHAKANPLPLLLGAARAAGRVRRRLHVLFAGQFPNEAIQSAFQNAAKLAEGVTVHFLPGADQKTVDSAWQAADVFASLSDNIQESFGLTIVEAMAAGLPVIASDWDGYKDTVTDGVNGFLIPTVLAPSGAGKDLASRSALKIDNYDLYIGSVSLATAVDVEATAEAIVRLAEDPELRARMGAAGRAAARERFDWRHVVRAHQELWAELAGIRKSAPGIGERGPEDRPHPVNHDPFAVFAAHPTRQFSGKTTVRADDPAVLDQLFGLAVSNYMPAAVLPHAEIRALAERILAGPQLVETLLEGKDELQQARTMRTLAWLMKFGVVRLEG